MSSTHDMNGRPYAKLSEVKVGDTLIADGGFSCIQEGPQLIQLDSRGVLYFECTEGRHRIDGQADDGEHLIGLYKSEATT